MTWGKSVLLTIPLVLSGIFVVASPASAQDFTDTDWRSASTGGSHACGTDALGYLYCWGNDDHGQLGNTEALNSKTTPNRVGDSTGWTAVSAGGAHTCGIRSGKLYCWGSDEFGQIGNGSGRDDRATPGAAISGSSDWVAVSAGDRHTCAIRSVSGRRYLACWGDDSRGQVGNGSAGGPSSPAFVNTTMKDWRSISAGGSHTCGIRTISGKGPMLWCWGGDTYGQVGNGARSSPSVPAQIGSAYDWRSVSAGENHTCAIRGAGLLACWGSDASGQVGNGGSAATIGPNAPVQTAKSLPADWKTVSAGGAHTCATRSTAARLYCWGSNEYGQSIASNDTALFTSPQLYSGTWKGADAGGRLTCAIESDSQMTCWGVPEVPPDCPVDSPTNVYADRPWSELRYWKLTTPVDANDDGSPDEVKQPTLMTLDGTAHFDRLSSPTRIKFRADVDGATTSGSNYPRSELREMTQDGQYNRAAWNSNCGTHTMTVRQAITHLPVGKDEVVAGQIHDLGVDGGTGDVVFIHLDGPELTVQRDGSEVGVLDSSYELNEVFTVVFTATGGRIDIDYTNETSGTTKSINDVSPVFNNEQWFFKAGCYTQANSSNGSGYGEVLIYNLDVTHQ